MSEKKATAFKLAYIVLAVIACIGIGAWVYQQIAGLSITGMNNLTSWGLYITCFMWFVGLSAGGLIVASSASVFNIPSLKTVAKPAIILSTVCICCAALFILIDLGGIQRIWRMIIGLNITSPLAWDMIVILCYLIINIIYLRLYLAKEPNHKKIKTVSCVALPVAVLVHSVTAWIFGLQIGREWFSAIMAPLFVSSALDSGLALLLLVLVALNHFGVFRTESPLMTMLAGILAAFVAVDGFMVACELLTMGYPGGEHAAYLMQLVAGPTAPFFWFEIIAGIIIPFIMLAPRKNREKTSLVVIASTLVVLGVLCKRIWLLFTAFLTPNVAAAPGVTIGNANLAQNGYAYSMTGAIYTPTILEITIVIGAIALAALAFMVIANKFLKNPVK